MLRFLISLLLIFALQIAAEPALACSCDRSIVSRIVDYVPTAFVGRVVRVEAVSADEASPSVNLRKTNQVTTFEVLNVIKGNVTSPLRVFTYTDGAACGHDFGGQLGTIVTVPADIDMQGRLTTGYCHLIDINLPRRGRDR
jgi:hypothetical protein